MRRRAGRRLSRSIWAGALMILAGSFGAASACYEVPPNNPPWEGAAGFEWGGEGSSGDDTSGGSLNGGSASGGSTSGGATSTGGTATGGTATGGEGGAPSTGGTAGDAPDAGGTGGGGSPVGGSSGSAGSGSGGQGGTAGAAPSGGAGGAAGSGTSGSGGFSTDRDEFFGESRCSDEFELCEDFESSSLDTTIWRVQGPAPTIDSTRAARGMRSAHFHTEDNGLSLIHTTSIFPAPDNTYWGRLFVYFDSMPTAPMWAHWSIVGAVGSGNEAEIRVGGQYDGESNRFGVGTDHGPTGDWTTLDEDPGDPVPVREWVCIEWLHQGETNETRFFRDGVEHPSLHTTADEHGGPDDEQYVLPEFESLFVGWWLYQPGTEPPEFDVWIDEVALDYERIGCSR